MFETPHLAPMVGDGEYTTPLLDEAPWTDPTVPESYDFFGFYPLDVTGIEDSSRESSVVESTRDGGVPGRIRHATKTVVFNGMLLGASDKAVAYGAEWLRRVLLGDHCAGGDHGSGIGSDLTYAASQPPSDPTGAEDPERVLSGLLRTLRRFSVNSGPTITSKRTIESCGGEVWIVQFTGVAGNPYQYGQPRAILDGWQEYSGPGGSFGDPWASEAVPGAYDTDSVDFDEVDCGVDTWEPIYDPLCPALVVPPTPPSIPLGCSDLPETWARWSLTIPAANMPRWGTVVPVFTLWSTLSLRNMRLRIYSDPTESLDVNNNPCAFSYDIVVSYLPALSTMTIDGVSQSVWVETNTGQKRRADSLVFTTDSKPIEWPVLSCGTQHLLTLDLRGEFPVAPIVDLSFVHRVV